MNIKYTITENDHLVDGLKLGIHGGDVIALDGSRVYGKHTLKFINLEGTKENPIIITNVNGPVDFKVPTGMAFVLTFSGCKHFRITGGVGATKGMKFSNGHLGITCDQFTTNFEIDGIEVGPNIGFSGIMAKTDPTCAPATNRGYFVMRDSSIHDCYIHDTIGEGLYIGNSFYAGGHNIKGCGTRFPHDLENVKIYRNVIKNTGLDGIQMGCGVNGCDISYNTVENYGLKNEPAQRNGIQIGEGTGGTCTNNRIINGTGNGILCVGLGDNVIHKNIIINAGENGIFADDRAIKGKSFTFTKNIIINPKNDGFRLYAEGINNILRDNVIINPGSLNKSTRMGNDAYIFKLNNKVSTEGSFNNHFSTEQALVNYYMNLNIYEY